MATQQDDCDSGTFLLHARPLTSKPSQGKQPRQPCTAQYLHHCVSAAQHTAGNIIVTLYCHARCRRHEPHQPARTHAASALAAIGVLCGRTCTALTASWHMQPTMAATDAESAPPERGTRYPLAPDRRMKSHSQHAGPANATAV